MKYLVENVSILYKRDFVEWMRGTGYGNWVIRLLAACRFRMALSSGSRKGTDGLPCTVRFYEGFLEVWEEGALKRQIPYARIRRIRSTEHLHILECRKQQDVLLQKEKFTQGNMDEVRLLVYPKKKIG